MSRVHVCRLAFGLKSMARRIFGSALICSNWNPFLLLGDSNDLKPDIAAPSGLTLAAFGTGNEFLDSVQVRKILSKTHVDETKNQSQQLYCFLICRALLSRLHLLLVQ